MKKNLASLDSSLFETQGREAAGRIQVLPVWKHARTVLLFMSMPGEIDTLPLISLAITEKKNLYVPRVSGNNMEFFKIESPGGPWESGPFGIPEPPHNVQLRFDAGKNNFPVLAIVPGLAFDRDGNRLGRGKGYYDRFLQEHTGSFAHDAGAFFTIGLCLKEQILDQVPAGNGDRMVDAICAGKDYIEIKR